MRGQRGCRSRPAAASSRIDYTQTPLVWACLQAGVLLDQLIDKIKEKLLTAEHVWDTKGRPGLYYLQFTAITHTQELSISFDKLR